MSQLNEFIRTFSAIVYQLQNAGYDMYNNKGVDLFVGLDSQTDKQMNMIELIRNTKDGYYYLNGNKVFSGKVTAGATDTPAAAAGSDLASYLTNNEYTIKGKSETAVSANGINGKKYTLLDKNGEKAETILEPDDSKKLLTNRSSTK